MEQLKKSQKCPGLAFPIELPTLSPFFRVSPVILLDPRVSPRHLKVYLCLAAHYSDSKSKVTLTRERIAKMCGFTSGGKPDVRLVSKLIDATPAVQEQLGPGLVQLGYIKKTVKGFLMCNDYEFIFPELRNPESFLIKTAAGEEVQLRDPRGDSFSDRAQTPVTASKADKLVTLSTNEKCTSDINWTDYTHYFPSKYWSKSEFDSFVEALIRDPKHRIKSVLDVGAGVNGSFVLEPFEELTKYFLDPNISEIPKGYLPFDKNLKYDLILLRGCVNYLEAEELLNLKKALTPGGMLVFNTFYKKPSENKKTFEFYNKKGNFSLEESFYVPLENKIYHSIHTENKIFRHSFYYRDLNFWSGLLGRPLKMKLNGSSAYFIFGNK